MDYKEEIYQMIKDQVIEHIYVRSYKVKYPESLSHEVYFRKAPNEPGKFSFDEEVHLKENKEGFDALLDMYKKCMEQRDMGYKGGYKGTAMVYGLPIDWQLGIQPDDPFIIEDFNFSLDERHYAIIDNFIAQKEKEQLNKSLPKNSTEKTPGQRI